MDVFLKYNTFSSSSAVEQLFPRGAVLCYSYSKMSWLKVKKLPTAWFCEGKLRLFEVAKSYRIQDDFDDMPSMFSK